MNRRRVAEDRASKEMDGCPLTDGSYARLMSWQTASDIAIIWDPGSIRPSTSSLLSMTIVIDRRACDSWATLRGMGLSPGAKLLM
jgi:hypothetical protein